MISEYKKGVRESYAEQLSWLPSRLVDWFTGKPLMKGEAVKPGNPLALFASDVALIAAMVVLNALIWTHLSPGWALAAAYFPTLLLVGRLRMMQTLYGHEGSPGHDNFFPRGHSLRGSKTKILGLSPNDFISAAATSIALSQNEEDYGEAHGRHHDLPTFATMRDDDARGLYDAGFRPGMTVNALWRQFWWSLVSPQFHWNQLVARARSNWTTAKPVRRGMTIAMVAVLGALVFVMPIGAWVAAVLLPWTILFHFSGLMQALNRHGWLEVQDGFDTVEAYAQRTWGRFNGVPLPSEDLRGVAKVMAWGAWGLEMSLELSVRLFTWSYDLQAHDFHHLEFHGPKPFTDDWTQMPRRRQAAIDEGRDPYRMQDRELWGWRSAMRHSFGRLSQAEAVN